MEFAHLLGRRGEAVGQHGNIEGNPMNLPTSSGGAVRRWRSMTAPRSATRRVRCPCCAKSYAPAALNGVPTAKPASECASSITGDSSPAPAAAPLPSLRFVQAGQLGTLPGNPTLDHRQDTLHEAAWRPSWNFFCALHQQGLIPEHAPMNQTP